MMPTLTERIRELEEEGYTQPLTAENDELCNDTGTLRFEPGMLEIHDHFIFEGSSDPADATILFALCEPKTGTKATWIARRGAEASPSEREVAKRLLDGNHNRSGEAGGE